jgi:hypothetical protein
MLQTGQLPPPPGGVVAPLSALAEIRAFCSSKVAL